MAVPLTDDRATHETNPELTAPPTQTSDKSKGTPDLAVKVSTYLWRHRRIRLALLLLLPVSLLVGIYGISLVSLLFNSFYRLDQFTGRLDDTLSLDSWRGLFTTPNVLTAFRTIAIATSVTIASAFLALPLAYFVSRQASKRSRRWLILGIMVPLWSSYLVRVYSWKLILAAEGIANWFFDAFGIGFVLDAILELPVIGGPSLSFSWLGQFIVFVYIWLPYMVMPVQVSMDRVPQSLLDASQDLGAGPSRTFRKVLFPLIVPGVAAGSIFTFSLTLGDYIIPQVVGDSSPSIGYVIYSQQGLAGNLPAAAAFAFVPIVVMGLYLFVVGKLGAFKAL